MKIQTRDINRTQQRHTAVSLILHAVNLTGTHTLRGLSDSLKCFKASHFPLLLWQIS